jgi:hypothetical protein
VSIGRIEEYLESKRWEYLTASKREKGRILDEVCDALRYHRKAAIRTLRQKPGQERKRSGRPRRYGSEVVSALRQVWEASDQLCGKRLAPFLPTLVPVLEHCKELSVTRSGSSWESKTPSRLRYGERAELRVTCGASPVLYTWRCCRRPD